MCWVPRQLCINAALLCAMTASPAERIWETLNISVLGGEKKKRRRNYYHNDSHHTKERGKVQGTTELLFQLSELSPCYRWKEKLVGGVGLVWCTSWLQAARWGGELPVLSTARCFGRCSMPGMRDGMWQHLCECCCFFPLGSLCLEAMIIIDLFWCSAWVIFLLSRFRRKRDYKADGDTLLWSQIEGWRMTVIKFLLSTNLIC